MTELILDYSKWRCGGQDIARALNVPDIGIGVGVGLTALCNTEGFMCCLGQWTKQLHPEYRLIGKGRPRDLGEMYEFTERVNGQIESSFFATEAMLINDSQYTSVDEKIQKLTELCKTYKYKLTVINKPDESPSKNP